MEKLYYHKDKNFLMDWLMLNNMSTGEIALWHTLMNIGNRLGQKSEFNAPTSTLMKLTGLSKQGTVNARKKLMDRGFIAYEKGRQHKAPIYKMIAIHQTIDHYFSFVQHDDLTPNLTSELTQSLTENFSHKSTIHKEQNTNEIRSGRGSEQPWTSLYQTYKKNIGQLPPLIQDELLGWIDDMGEMIVKEALIITVKKGGKTFSYLEKILQQWKQAGIKTLEDVHAHELEKELAKTNKLIPFKKQRNKQKSHEESLDAWLKEE